MTGSSLKYLIREGFRNTWTNRMMSVASICVLLCCLVLIGSASMLFLNVNALVDKIGAENVIMVYIKDDTTDDQIAEMGDSIRGIANVEKIEFVAKEDAWAEQLSTMDPASAKLFTDVSDDIPLPDAYKVTVKDLAEFSGTVAAIESLDNIEIVRRNTDLAKKLSTVSNGVSVFAIIIIAVLFGISLFIISNTIKLTVYSRRLEISIMKSVGATNSFVRLPFVVEGIILGVISGAVSLGVVWGGYSLLVNNEKFREFFGSMNITPLDFSDYALIMLGVFVLIGIITGVGGSLITMRKYLNKEGSEINAI